MMPDQDLRGTVHRLRIQRLAHMPNAVCLQSRLHTAENRAFQPGGAWQQRSTTIGCGRK